MKRSYSDEMMELDGLFTQARRTADYRRYMPLDRTPGAIPLFAKLGGTLCFVLTVTALLVIWAHTS